MKANVNRRVLRETNRGLEYRERLAISAECGNEDAIEKLKIVEETIKREALYTSPIKLWGKK